MSGPAVTVAQFRLLLPEFADSSVYLDEQVDPWLTLAASLLDALRWGTAYNLGVALFTAHQLTLQRQAVLIAQRGGIPGTSTGIVQSKSINGVSVSYNTSMSFLQGAGDWNLSVYGVRFIGFARMFGSGGVLVVGSDAALISEAQLVGATTSPPLQN